MPPMAPPSFVSTSCCAARIASLTAARTMSASSSGSSGSIASGEMVIALISSAPVALTVTIPPPAEASTVSPASSSCAFAICSCISWACFIGFSKAMAMVSAPSGSSQCARSPHAASLFVDLPGVERLLDQRDQILLACGFLLDRLAVAAVRAELEGEREPAACHFVEGVGEQGRILRLLGELAMKSGVPRKLECQRVAGEAGRVGFAQHRCRRDRFLFYGREHGALPGFLELLEVDRRRLAGRRLLGPWHRLLHSPFGGSPQDGSGLDPILELLEAVRRRLPRKVGRSPRHLDERELERQALIGPLAHVLDGHGEQVAEAEHGRLAELVRLLVQALAHLLGP